MLRRVQAHSLAGIWVVGLLSILFATSVNASGFNSSLKNSLESVASQPVNDTLLVTIPADSVSVYCIPDSVIDFTGTLTAYAICEDGNPGTVQATSILDYCVTLNPASGFTGLSPDLICVVHCFDNSTSLCDTNFLELATVPANCDEIFLEDTLLVTFPGVPQNVCIPLSPLEAGNYELSLDGNPYLNLIGCDFDSVIVYSYGLLPGGGFAGPYQLNQWTVNGQSFNGFFNNVANLVVFMNFVDPGGNWQLNSAASIIFGGQISNSYGNMDVTHIPSTSNSILSVNYSILPNGLQVQIADEQPHFFVALDPVTFCSDTLVINPQPYQPQTDTLFLSVVANSASDTFCLSGAELPGGIENVGICLAAQSGQVPIFGDSCFQYMPQTNFAGSDTFCVVVCNDAFPQLCDSTMVFVEVLPANDTLELFLPAGTTQLDTCLSEDFIQVPPPYSDIAVCQGDPEIDVNLDGNCVSVIVSGENGGTVSCYFLHCNDQFCDTTWFFVEVEPAVICDELFTADTLFLTSVGDTAVLCIDVPVSEIGNFQASLNGADLSTSLLSPCGAPSQVSYDVLSLPAGPYFIESWTAGGNQFFGAAPDLGAIVDSLNGWDPAGLWAISGLPPILTGGVPGQNYGPMLVSSLATGQTDTLMPVPFGPPGGSLFNIAGTGSMELILIAPDGCADTALLIVEQHQVAADTVTVQTYVNEPVPEVCVSTDELLGDLTQFAFCQTPQYGAFSQVGPTCVGYAPNTNFTGTDTLCIIICDDFQPVVCDTQVIVFEVIQKTDTLSLTTFEEVPSQISCLDTTSLPGNFVGVTLCQSPQSGNILLNQNCFSYNPNPGFIGQDTACLLVCDDAGICDTNLVYIQVDSLCSLFEFIPADTLSVEAASCSDQELFCVELNFDSLAQWGILDNGVPVSSGLSACAGNNTQVALDTGFHEVIFVHMNTGCRDTLLADVSCPVDSTGCGFAALSPLSQDLPDCDSTAKFCFEVPFNDLDLFETKLNGTHITSGWQACDTISFASQLELGPGAYELVIADTVKGCADTFQIAVNCPMPCEPWFQTDTVGFANSSCSSQPGQLCLPVSVAEAEQMIVEINGMVYPGGYQPCGFRIVFSIPYGNLPDQGQAGPYLVENWTVNGINFNGQFSTAQDLATLMSLWDPFGNWEVVVDQQTGSVSIEGGNAANTYGPIKIKQQSSGITVSLGISQAQIPEGAAIALPAGTYQLSLTDTLNGCQQEVTAIIACVNTDYLQDQVVIGDVDTICVDFDELIGNPVSIESPCPGSGGEVAAFALDGNCLIYLGLETGFDEACIIVCDEYGICDTTFLEVEVVEEEPFLDPPIAEDDWINTGEGQPVVVQVLENDTINGMTDIFILDKPSNGEVFILTNNDINYVPQNGYCDDNTPDEFSYVICNPIGCDTAVVQVAVACSQLTIFDAFSPNGDGVNETFTIYGLSNYPGHILRIYNRWGNLVYEAVNYQSNWDGTWEGKKLPYGTYFYVLDLNNGEEPLAGYVQLMR
ncbi:MAG: hypothetical protein CMN32_01780 [Saprospirales bacterium]|nr:hypothetical protein [Saprospirales bacterium]